MCRNKPPQKQIICSYWNINGYKSKIIGNKLSDPQFLEMVSGTDILGLAEIHAEGEIFVPGFKLKKQKIREKKFKGPKVAGGLALLVREEIDDLVQVIPNMNDDSIWIKLGKRSHDENEEVYIGTYYVSPPSKSKKSQEFDFFTDFNEEINSFQKKGVVLVQGDLNARTGHDKDFVEYDKFDPVGVENLCNQHIRNSQDLNTNARGKELLDVCKLNDLLIMNGRKVGDLFGNYTSHQWNGSSVVDYFLAPNNFSQKNLNFSVGDFIPWISDHCPIHTTFILQGNKITGKKDGRKLTDLPPRFIWDENSKGRFVAGLKSETTSHVLNLLAESSSDNPLEIAKQISGVLMSNAHDCNIKTKVKPKNTKKSKSKPHSEPWFDSECEGIKKQLENQGRNLRKIPSDKSTRQTIFNLKRVLKKMTKRKKRSYKASILKLMTDKKNEKKQKEFWKLLDKFSSRSTPDSLNVPAYHFLDHFKGLLVSKTTGDIPPMSEEIGPLDYAIDMKELENASKILKPGKAAGIDNIDNEFISSLFETHPKILLKLFNAILTSSEVIPEWVMGLIVPIFKKGSKSEPSNYRGITLMSCLGKLFLAILNNRLMRYAIHNKILHKSQLGFVPGNRTSDAHIIINNLIQKYCHKNNSKIFSCFVDFSKAFDTIPRDILLKKLLSHNIKGKFFNIIRNIYADDKAGIKIQNQCTETFEINMGVRQGCVLSPLLFNIFLSDLPQKLDLTESKVKLGNTELASLVWADDIVLMSESESGLQQMINVLENYCQENKLKINTDKTKCMIFNKTGRIIRRNFYANGILLDIARSYKYLGFLVTPSGEIKSGLQDLRDRALKAFMKLKNTLGIAFNKTISTTISLIEALVKPILLYNSDFWGCMKLPKANPIENLHIMMCKQLLGVQKQTTNIGVLLELGRVPMQLFAVKLATKNWERLKQKKANSLLNLSFEEAIKEDLYWISSIKEYLEKNGMLSLYLNTYENKPFFIHKKLFQTLSDSFHQNAFETIQNNKSKLRTYAIFKTEIGCEKYLQNIQNPTTRTILTKFRLSNHRLMIEVGRFKGIPKDMRFCPFCPALVETESHFLLCCTAYNLIRGILMDIIKRTNPNFIYYSEEQKLKYLLQDITPSTVMYIKKSWELREFLTAQHKRAM